MLIVQKYGGTSVGSVERIAEVAKRVAKTKSEGKEVIVIVSAMSGVTDELISYSKYFSDFPNLREMDKLLSSGEQVTSALLAIALNEKGIKAKSFSGREAGMLTDDNFTKAKIQTINTKKLEEALKEGYIAVVAGFQGVTKDDEITTLGRGGSDLSAVAIAGAMKADLCEIYTDVDGIYTTDPRIEPQAKKLDKIAYEEMLELASLGAKVLQNRSVELAKKLNVNLVTRNSFNDNEGTLITEGSNLEEAIIRGIALDKNQTRITIRHLKDSSKITAQLFKALADANIIVDMIVQNVGSQGEVNISFTVLQSEEALAFKVVEDLSIVESCESDNNVAKVSIIGVGMKSHSTIASTAFEALASEGIEVQMISTSEIKISFIVSAKFANIAVQVLHKAFKLGK